MGLTQEQIKALLAKPQRGRGKGSKAIDVSVRDHATWFKLAHKLYDRDEPNNPAKCSNPNCLDPRESGSLVAEVNGTDMCRYCFLEGYNLASSSQLKLGNG